jgi:SAM-dependent methyltransferase/uncharacterized protein YbaR (Trm112 family)
MLVSVRIEITRSSWRHATGRAFQKQTQALEKMMHGDLIELLRCPDCSGRWELLGPHHGGRIDEGELRCVGCGRISRVDDGIPRLVPSGELSREQRATADHFTGEFSLVAEGDHDLGDPALNRWIFYTRTGLDPGIFVWQPADWYPSELPEDAPQPDETALQGCWVLDAGCGPGRLATVAARSADRLVGLDLGDHIDRAARVCGPHGNVDLVQGSVLTPPFADGSFDVVYSVGVLHHTPDPQQAVAALARLVRPGGRLCVWVYPPEYWGGRLRGPANRLVHRVLRGLSPRAMARVVRFALYPLGRLQSRIARRRWLKRVLAPLFLISVPRSPRREVMLATILDYFGPRIISTHPPAEVASWLRDAGLEEVEILPVRSSAIGRRPRQVDPQLP